MTISTARGEASASESSPVSALESPRMAKLDWQKARERELTRETANATPAGPVTVRRRGAQQEAFAAFVERHDLRCFKCGAPKADWAKTGISKRGPWAICAPCVVGRGEAPRLDGEGRESTGNQTPAPVPADTTGRRRRPSVTRNKLASAGRLAATEARTTDGKGPIVYTDGACSRN